MAALSKKRGMPAVLIFRNVAVVSSIALGVPIMAIKLEERGKSIAAITLEKMKIIVVMF